MKKNKITTQAPYIQFIAAMSAFSCMLVVSVLVSQQIFLSEDRSVATGVASINTSALCASLPDTGIINIVKFGANGNDTEDDTRAMKAAFECALEKYTATGAANKRANVSILIPQGNFYVKESLQFKTNKSYRYGGGIKIFGAGETKSIIISNHVGTVMDIAVQANQPVVRYLVEAKSFGIKSNKKGGTALAIRAVNGSENQRNVQAKIKDIEIGATVENVNYFKYGLYFSDLMLPKVHYLTMTGVRNDEVVERCVSSSCMDVVQREPSELKTHSCIFANKSYGTGVFNLSCQGAMYGVNIIKGGEGEMIVDSNISDTNLGIFLSTDSENRTGPSAMDGKITNNTIYAHRRGIQVQDKSWIVITNNTLGNLAGDGKYEDIVLYGSTWSKVIANNFTGNGANRTNLFLSAKIGNVARDNYQNIIAFNKFAGAAHAVILGKGTSETTIQGNTMKNINKKLWNLSSETQGEISI